MFKNIIPLAITASKFVGRTAATTLVAMGTYKGTEYVVDGLSRWNERRKAEKAKKQAAQPQAAAA